jgi:ankyrin repeat protein
MQRLVHMIMVLILLTGTKLVGGIDFGEEYRPSKEEYQQAYKRQLNGRLQKLEKTIQVVKRKCFPDRNHKLMYEVCSNKADEALSDIHKGADVNVQDGYGDTPLIMASRLGHVAVVKMLLEQQKQTVNIDQKNKWGCTALSAASGVKKDNTEIIKLLSTHGANQKKVVGQLEEAS